MGVSATPHAMINKKTLAHINSEMERKEKMEEILRGFEGTYVIALAMVNPADRHDIVECAHTTFFHRKLTYMQWQLKRKAAELIKAEIKKIDAWLAKRKVA